MSDLQKLEGRLSGIRDLLDGMTCSDSLALLTLASVEVIRQLGLPSEAEMLVADAFCLSINKGVRTHQTG